MRWKEFTPQELTELKKNPYVKSVTTKMVRFTVAFKEKFWEQYQDGKSPKTILTDLGFDLDVLGESRINGILQHVKEAAGSSGGFRDVRQPSVLVEKMGDLAPSKALVRMQHELEYMKQEVEFIKKIILADREANRKCSLKGGPALNSDSSGR